MVVDGPSILNKGKNTYLLHLHIHLTNSGGSLKSESPSGPSRLRWRIDLTEGHERKTTVQENSRGLVTTVFRFV